MFFRDLIESDLTVFYPPLLPLSEKGDDRSVFFRSLVELYSATLHHQIFAKVNRQIKQEKRLHIHATNDKDLRIFRNAGGTVRPLFAEGVRGGKMKGKLTIFLSLLQ